MSDTLFLQFTTRGKFTDFVDLGNGFSDTYDFCKTKGDFYYVPFHGGLHWANMGRLMTNTVQHEKFENLELPIKKGTIYACVIYIAHIYQLWVWARKYPDIKFVVGGPAAFSMMYSMTEEMPSNMEVWEGSLEDYFGIENFSHPWKIEIPDFCDGENVVMSYTIEGKCYWGKCSYCNYAFCKQRKREEINFGFEDVPHNGTKIVRLNSPSLSPTFMKSLFPILPKRDNIRYDCYFRTGPGENKALRELIPYINEHDMKFISGMEFPSDDMLLQINKGITMKDVNESIEIFSTLKHEFKLFIILFMDNLSEKYVDEVQQFVDNIPPNDNIHLAMTRLFVKPHTNFYEMYKEKGHHIHLGPFYYGYINDLPDDQIILNKRIKQILYQYPNIRDFTKGILSWDNEERFKDYFVYREGV